MSVRVAIVQEKAVFLNAPKTLEKVLHLLDECGKQKAELAVFGESWFSGYPAWLDYCVDYARWDHEPSKEVFSKFHKSSITVPGKETNAIAKKAKEHGLTLVIGVNERVDEGPANGTVFNSLLTFGPDGEILNHHRKLMPTYTEKLLYGTGDGAGLKSVETSFGKLSGLICWEHWMPLARQTMHNSGEHIHVAVWPTVHEMHQVCSRHYAFEGRCYVIAVGLILQVKDLPQELELVESLKNKPEEMILKGGSCIIAPNGKYLLEPQFEKMGIITYEIEDTDDVFKERMTLDTTGHYQRADVFQLDVNKKRLA
ncbi:MAG: carbon-nitrogen hydrolase family protein [Bacteroidota bacterium]